MKDHTPITVGVDVSKAHLDAHELPSGRAERFDNNAAGITKLSRWISPDVDCLAYESTGVWHRALEEALAGTLPLACVNAARARRFAQALGQEAKTDAVDAKVLAWMAAALDLRRVEPPSQAHRDLAELKTARDRTAVLHRRDQARHTLVKRQLKLRLGQIERQIKALNAEIAKLIAPVRNTDLHSGRGRGHRRRPHCRDARAGSHRRQGRGQLGWFGAGYARVGEVEGSQLHPRRTRPRTAGAVHVGTDCHHLQPGHGSQVPGPASTWQASEGRPDRHHAQAHRTRQRPAGTGSSVVAPPWTGNPIRACRSRSVMTGRRLPVMGNHRAGRPAGSPARPKRSGGAA